jgi:hypothetical protein
VKNMYSKGLYNEYLKTILKFAKWNWNISTGMTGDFQPTHMWC